MLPIGPPPATAETVTPVLPNGRSQASECLMARRRGRRSREGVRDEGGLAAVRRPRVDCQGALPAEQRVALERGGPVGGGDRPDFDVEVGGVAEGAGWEADV